MSHLVPLLVLSDTLFVTLKKINSVLINNDFVDLLLHFDYLKVYLNTDGSRKI